MSGKMRNTTLRFLRISLGLVAALCVLVFAFLGFYMNRRSIETITEVGSIYMSSMSRQISMHFETTMDLRLAQLEALVASTDQAKVGDNQQLWDILVENARIRDFDHVSLYTADGRLMSLCGHDVTVTDMEPFRNSLEQGEKKVAVGKDDGGETVILLSVPAHYSMDDGGESVALVGTLPAEYIRETLSLDENADREHSYIIRRDGSFVVRSSGAFRQNYFDRVRSLYHEVSGKSPEVYIQELRDAMDANEDYSGEFLFEDGDRWHLYCTRLAYSEWYLVTFVPYSAMDTTVRDFTTQWITLALLGGAVILAVLLMVFFKYISITRKQMQELDEARQKADAATKAKSDFLSNMSHDIRTPMNAIVGMTAIATANIDDTEQVQNCLKKITLSSKHLLGLINDVLDMSKIESGKMTLSVEMVSLREVMDSIVSIVQPQIHMKHQQFNVQIHDISVENVYCDSVRLNQVLLNFLSNAIKFTPDGGQISIALSEEESPVGEDYIRTHLWVRDNGIGMSPEFQAKMFESFTREDSTRVHKTEGTGLGMAITKYIVDAMGGTIDVKSALGEGTEFHVTLDLERADVPESEMILPDWNMLVVDDDQQLCESAVNSLQSIGVKADWTLDGESAVEMADKRHQIRDDYHIILLDWKLPGIDGIETARRLRQRLGEDVPIMLISAYDWSEIEKEAREAGITGFISKPLFKSTLYHGLRGFAGIEGDQPVVEEGDHSLEGRKVLLAEDNDLNWEIANELLTSELGLELDWAENGQICVDKFQASPVGYYDAILMDIRMPVMTGYDATKAIRALDRPDKGLPIIAMTADAFAEDVKRCLDCGMNAHISKPIDVRDVARLLKKFIFERDET